MLMKGNTVLKAVPRLREGIILKAAPRLGEGNAVLKAELMLGEGNTVLRQHTGGVRKYRVKR